MGTLFSLLVAVTLFVSSAVAECTSCTHPSLPAGPVLAQLDYGPGVGQPNIYFRITLSGLPAGFSVGNGPYHGWCADSYTFQEIGVNPVLLYSSYWANLPVHDQSPNWDKINWLINNKGANTMADIQAAIWLLLGQPIPAGYSYNSAAASAIVSNAYKFGSGFVPGDGQALAVIVSVGGIGNPSVDPSNKNQTTFIELFCPLTQGFWKNHSRVWPLTTINLGFISYNTGTAADVNSLLAIFDTPVRGNANISLEHQLIAAELNVAAGVNPAPVQATINAAIAALISSGGANVSDASALGQLMESLANTLDAFNSGTLPGVCATGAD
jgi:hypothetical protein